MRKVIFFCFLFLLSCSPKEESSSKSTESPMMMGKDGTSMPSGNRFMPGNKKPFTKEAKKTKPLPPSGFSKPGSSKAPDLSECIGNDDESLSRILKFSGCRDDVYVEHIGLSETGHNANSVIDYDNVAHGTHYMLKHLGVYDIEPISRDEEEDDGLDLTGTLTTFYLDDTVLNADGEEVEVERSFIVHIPSDYDETKLYPVVFAFHGNGGTAGGWKKAMSDIIDEGQFVGIYPQGYKDTEVTEAASWNLGKEKSTADDFLFFKKILEKISDLSPSAEKRFSIGISNGAALTNFLVANSEEKLFAGIGTGVSGLIYKDVDGNEKVTLDVSGKTYHYGLEALEGTKNSFHVVAISGMTDNIITYCGGDQKTNYNMPSAEESIRMWAEYLGCDDPEGTKVRTVDLSSGDRKDLSKK